MANFFTRLVRGELDEYTNLIESTVETQLGDLRSESMALSLENERLQESMRELSLYVEDLNWLPIDGWEQEQGFPLRVIKEHADRLQALLTVNPTIKKAINARVGYIWSKGVTFKKKSGASLKRVLDNERNYELLFDDDAHWSMEAALATAGNVWVARNKDTEELVFVPITQIGGWVADPVDPTRVNYWYRSYSVKKTNFRTGSDETKTIEEFIPAAGYKGKVPAIDGIKVNNRYEMIHIGVNRQRGWVLGIPDIMAASFWAKAHKELFESGTTYVKAQGKFASKVVAKSALGANRAAATVANSPRRDPDSGEILDTGGTAVMSGGLDYQLMGKMSGGVDFDAFDPVAALVAVGLGLPVSVLLGKSPDTEVSLEQTTVDEMNLRRKTWSKFFRQIFGPSRDVEVVWPKIKTEPTYRLVQSLEISNRTNSLSPQEIRGLTLEAYGIQGDPEDLPEIEENNYYLLQTAISAKNSETSATNTDSSGDATTPEQGVDAGIGKLSTGADAKDSRNDKSDRNTKDE